MSWLEERLRWVTWFKDVSGAKDTLRIRLCERSNVFSDVSPTKWSSLTDVRRFRPRSRTFRLLRGRKTRVRSIPDSLKPLSRRYNRTNDATEAKASCPTTFRLLRLKSKIVSEQFPPRKDELSDVSLLSDRSKYRRLGREAGGPGREPRTLSARSRWVRL